jgi:hypothetical protein
MIYSTVYIIIWYIQYSTYHIMICRVLYIIIWWGYNDIQYSTYHYMIYTVLYISLYDGDKFLLLCHLFRFVSLTATYRMPKETYFVRLLKRRFKCYSTVKPHNISPISRILFAPRYNYILVQCLVISGRWTKLKLIVLNNVSWFFCY